MKNRKVAYLTCIGGILTSITVLLQAAPVYLPVVGLALSPFSTLPIAIAAIINPVLGLMVLISSFLILTFINLQEALILLFATGLLGIVLGVLLYRKRASIAFLFSTIALTKGMLILTYCVAVPGFVDFTASIGFPLVLMIFHLFSIVYTLVWIISLKKVVHYTQKVISFFVDLYD